MPRDAFCFGWAFAPPRNASCGGAGEVPAGLFALGFESSASLAEMGGEGWLACCSRERSRGAEAGAGGARAASRPVGEAPRTPAPAPAPSKSLALAAWRRRREALVSPTLIGGGAYSPFGTGRGEGKAEKGRAARKGEAAAAAAAAAAGDDEGPGRAVGEREDDLRPRGCFTEGECGEEGADACRPPSHCCCCSSWAPVM